MCSTHEGVDKVYTIFDGKHGWNRVFDRHRSRWEDNIKLQLKEL
jgi:hypothetical protein